MVALMMLVVLLVMFVAAVECRRGSSGSHRTTIQPHGDPCAFVVDSSNSCSRNRRKQHSDMLNAADGRRDSFARKIVSLDGVNNDLWRLHTLPPPRRRGGNKSSSSLDLNNNDNGASLIGTGAEILSETAAKYPTLSTNRILDDEDEYDLTPEVGNTIVCNDDDDDCLVRLDTTANDVATQQQQIVDGLDDDEDGVECFVPEVNKVSTVNSVDDAAIATATNNVVDSWDASCLSVSLVTLPRHSNPNVNTILEQTERHLRTLQEDSVKSTSTAGVAALKDQELAHDEQIYANNYVDLGKIETYVP